MKKNANQPAAAEKRNNRNIRKTAVYGMIIALALVFSYLEAQIPPLFAVPGMKLGLTNIIVLVSLYKLNSGSAMLVNVLRIVLVSFLFGGLSAMLYSLAGGMLSTLVMILLKRTGRFRVVTVSVAGGISHNVGQIMVAMAVMNTAGIAWYLVILWFSGMASGTLIGLLGYELIKRLPDKLFRWENR